MAIQCLGKMDPEYWMRIEKLVYIIRFIYIASRRADREGGRIIIEDGW